MVDALALYLIVFGTIMVYAVASSIVLLSRYIWRELLLLAMVALYIAWRMT